MKQIIITILAVVGIVGAAVVFGGGEDVASGQPSNNFYGQEEGIITVVEYADFECPACASFAPIVNQVKEQFKDQVRFEFRHFPLVQIHANAQAAHRAAQAAANQGKFWEMHDILFQRQTQWRTAGTTLNNGTPITNGDPTQTFEEYARELGLDVEQFRADAASSDTLATINADLELGKQADVTGTPTFIIDGEKIEDTSNIADTVEFAARIQAAIDSKQPTQNEPAETQSETEAVMPEESTDPDEQ